MGILIHRTDENNNSVYEAWTKNLMGTDFFWCNHRRVTKEIFDNPQPLITSKHVCEWKECEDDSILEELYYNLNQELKVLRNRLADFESLTEEINNLDFFYYSQKNKENKHDEK